jgi:hypothetical protein
MGENIKDFGRMENNTARVNSLIRKKTSGRKVSGMRVRESAGLVKVHRIILSF